MKERAFVNNPAGSARARLALPVLKWAALAAIAIIALLTIDFTQALASLGAFGAETLLLFALLAAVSHVFYDARLVEMAAGTGLRRPSLRFAVRLNLLSEFVSIVLPSYLGGDGLRLLRLRPFGDTATAAVCVLLDRVVGLATLGAAAAAGLPSIITLLNIAIDPPLIGLGVALLTVGALVAVRVGPLLLRRFGLAQVQLRGRPLARAVVLSLAGHLLYAGAYAALFAGLPGAELPGAVLAAPIPPLSQALAVTLLALLARAVPISFLGLEASDASLVVLAGLIGIGSGEALAVVAVVLASRYAFALIGLAWEAVTDGLGFLRPSVHPPGGSP